MSNTAVLEEIGQSMGMEWDGVRRTLFAAKQAFKISYQKMQKY